MGEGLACQSGDSDTRESGTSAPHQLFLRGSVGGGAGIGLFQQVLANGLAGGELVVASAAGEGTALHAKLPLRSES